MRAAATAVVLATLAPGGAAADEAASAARAHFQKAEASFNLGNFDTALASYQAAYKAKPLPGLLFNIAQCHRNLGKHERALFFYRRYLALDPETPNRALVEQLIAEEENRKEASARAAPPAEPTRLAPPPLALAPPPAAAAPAPADPPSARGRARSEDPPMFVKAAPREASAENPPVYKRWWFWTGLAGVAAAGVATALVIGSASGGARSTGTLRPIDWR